MNMPTKRLRFSGDGLDLPKPLGTRAQARSRALSPHAMAKLPDQEPDATSERISRTLSHTSRFRAQALSWGLQSPSLVVNLCQPSQRQLQLHVPQCTRVMGTFTNTFTNTLQRPATIGCATVARPTNNLQYWADSHYQIVKIQLFLSDFWQ